MPMDPMQQQMMMRMLQSPNGQMPPVPQGQGGVQSGMAIGPGFGGPDMPAGGVGDPMAGGAQPLPMEGPGSAQPLPPYTGGGAPDPLDAGPMGTAPRINLRGAEQLPPAPQRGGSAQPLPADVAPRGIGSSSQMTGQGEEKMRQMQTDPEGRRRLIEALMRAKQQMGF